MEWFKVAAPAVLEHISGDPEALRLLVNAQTRDGHTAFNTYTWCHLPIPPSFCDANNRRIWELRFLDDFLATCGRNPDIACPALRDALSHRKAIREQQIRSRHRFTTTTYIHPNSLSINPLPPVPSIDLRKPKTVYPPHGHFVCETEAIRARWEPHLTSRKLADNRHARRPCHLLDPAKLSYDIGPTQSRLLYFRGKLVGGVFRGFCRDPRGTRFADKAVRKEAHHKKSVRRDDPGKIQLVGYTAGALSDSKFDWAKNLIGPARPADSIRASDQECSAAFAFLWNMCRQRLPQEVIKAFDDYLESNQIRRMDGHGTMVSEGAADLSHGNYAMYLEDGLVLDFCNVELAPPSGAIGYNYSRAIHSERQPVPWGIAWTTSRTGGPADGGSFFLSKYGIRIAGAANTLVFWKNGEPHGSGLQDYDPYDPNPPFFQAGLCLFVGNRLAGAWAKYQKNKLTQAQAVQFIDEGADEDIDYGDKE